ncbi:alpha/beta hydrolase [Actinobacillus capsulatus]|uniref:alpha/beta hydrolase n=1 Tax=Actinobacillus capsulatus TaxID=717 RepID=UPI0003A72157|nr:alpha/beta hydrolase [Actinobacillus capsulatus]
MNKFFKTSVISTALLGALAMNTAVFANSTANKSASAQTQSATVNIYGISIEQGKIYSEAHRKSIAPNMQKVRYNNNGIEMVGNVYFPQNFDKDKRYPAIIVGHPGGGVKEQASGLYAKLLAENGFVAIAFDASYQGESGGLPRRLEKPENRIGDFHATVDYLTALPYVDKDKIALLGICAGYRAGKPDRQACQGSRNRECVSPLHAFLGRQRDEPA